MCPKRCPSMPVSVTKRPTADRTIQRKLRRLLYPDKYGSKPKSTPSLPSNIIIIGASCDVSSIDTTANSKTASSRTPPPPREDSGTTCRTRIASVSCWSTQRPPLPKAKASPESTTSTMKQSPAELDVVVEGKNATIAIIKKTRRTAITSKADSLC